MEHNNTHHLRPAACGLRPLRLVASVLCVRILCYMPLIRINLLLLFSLLATIVLLVAAFFSYDLAHGNLWRFLSWPAHKARLWNGGIVLQSITDFIFTKHSQGNVHIAEALILIFTWWPVTFAAMYFTFRTKRTGP